MKNLFITTHGLKLSKSGSYLVIKGKEINEKIPLGAFTNVFILSNVSMTTQVLKFLSRNGKYVFIINTAGKLQSIVVPEIVTSAIGNRIKQYKSQFLPLFRAFQVVKEIDIRRLQCYSKPAKRRTQITQGVAHLTSGRGGTPRTYARGECECTR